jgi:hypothetical protein
MNQLCKQGVPVQQLPPKQVRMLKADFLEIWNKLAVGAGADKKNTNNENKNDKNDNRLGGGD